MSTRNRMGNLDNRYQGDFRRVLCVCSAGMLRSPTCAWVLSNPPYNFNTRAVGLNKEYALTPIDEALVFWADDIIVMDEQMRREIETIIEMSRWKEDFEAPNIYVWKIPDMFNFRDPELVEKIEVLAKKTYQNPRVIHANVTGGIECNHCGYMSPDYAENCCKCKRRLTEV